VNRNTVAAAAARQRPTLFIALCALGLALLSSAHALASPVTFALTTSQSSINLNVKNANIFGTTLSVSEQATGSLNSKYSGNIVTDITGTSISLPGGSNADASELSGLFGIKVNLAPGVGGVGALAPADYGAKLDAPIGIDIPAIDLSFLNIPGLSTIDFGAFQSVVVNMALRNVVADVTSPGYLPRSGVPNNTTFDSSQLGLSLSGDIDLAIGAVLRAGDYLSYTANNLALQGLASALNAQIPNLINVTGYNVLNFGGPYDLTLSLGTGFKFSGVNVANEDASLGKLSTIPGNKLQLTLPVSFNAIPDLSGLGSFSGIFSSLVNMNMAMSGQLVGTVSRNGLIIPEPASVVTFGIGFLALAFYGWRRQAG